MTLRLTLTRWLVPDSHVVVPREPTAKMLQAAAKSMSPDHRPTQEWVSVRKKHAIRYAAMIKAGEDS
jgi:hypothetical protein